MPKGERERVELAVIEQRAAKAQQNVEAYKAHLEAKRRKRQEKESRAGNKAEEEVKDIVRQMS